VVRKILRDSVRFAEIIDGLSAADRLVRMRCADVAEKVSLAHPEWLRPYKRYLLRLASRATEQEMRWHLAQMLPRLALSCNERSQAEAALRRYLDDESRIVKIFALQALYELSLVDPGMRQCVMALLRDAERNGTAAMRARARKLLEGFPS
jgi:hypothetical protein